jgi:nickel-dependent lactate racemase
MPSSSCPEPLLTAIGSSATSLSDNEVRHNINSFLEAMGTRRDVLILPPDFTRFHSQAGMITRFICEYYGFIQTSDDVESNALKNHADESSSVPQIQIIPALGTHAPMTQQQIQQMFGTKLATKTPSPFVTHNWRSDVVTIGYAPEEMVETATRGVVREKWPAQLNRLVWEKRRELHDNEDGELPPLVISVGQVVPHEGEEMLYTLFGPKAPRGFENFCEECSQQNLHRNFS